MPTKIEWSDETWNPIIGCSRISPGCDNCYAIGVVHREMSPQHVGLTTKSIPVDWTGEVRPAPQVLDKPLRWKRGRRIFVNSRSDLFHADLPDEAIAKVFTVMRACPQHQFQVLTKRSKRMRDFMGRLAWRTPTSEEAAAGARGYQAYLFGGTADENQASCGGVEPLPNVWLGVSVETDAYAFRADHLRATPAAIRWISAEPLLGPLPSLDLTGIDWVVAGSESGPKARPMHEDWVRDLRDRCGGESTRWKLEHGPHGASRSRVADGGAGRLLLLRCYDDGGWVVRHPDDGVIGGGTFKGDADLLAGAQVEADAWELANRGRPAFFYKQRLEGKRKVETPEMDGRQWLEYPS